MALENQLIRENQWRNLHDECKKFADVIINPGHVGVDMRPIYDQIRQSISHRYGVSEDYVNRRVDEIVNKEKYERSAK